jgi:two-component system, chemotaxis family, sensor kinase CheA
MSGMSDDGLILEFVTESKEHLGSIEPDLLILEKEGRSAGDDIINKVFRAIHSIKGAAGFFGLEALKNLSHTMESVLMMVREGKLDPTPDVMDPLLVGVDKLGLMLEDIQNSESVPYEEEVQRLEALMGNPSPAHVAKTETPSDLPSVANNAAQASAGQTPEPLTGQAGQNIYHIEPATLEAAGKGGQHLFWVTLSTSEDIIAKSRSLADIQKQLASVGSVLESVISPFSSGAPEPGSTVNIVCSSVLEADLLALAIDCDVSKVAASKADAILNAVYPGAVSASNNNPAPVSSSGQPNSASGSQLTQATLDTARKGGQHLYCVTLSTNEDIIAKNRLLFDVEKQLASVGTVLETVVSPASSGQPEPGSSIKIICATVLEYDLLALAIDCDLGKISPTTPEEILKAQGTTVASQQAPVAAKSSAPAPAKKQEIPATEAKKPAAGNSSAESANESIRVRVDLLNRLMDLAGELVLSRNQLLRSIEHLDTKNAGLESISQNIDLVTSDLQEHIMQTRMQPVGSIFGKFPRIIRDMSKQLSKEIQLQTSGEDVELDKTILESLSDPLTHLIRNCCDHALETPGERKANGKSSVGTIHLKAFHEGGQINIAICDDGKGVDHERVVKKVISQGVMTEAEVKKLSTQEMVNLIFLPGLSTAEKVSDISGRGVGMDVVKTNIEKIGGTISIDTTMGKGTTILLRLPLTLAIIPSLIVGACNNRFAVPQVNLVELVCVQANDISSRIEQVGSASVLRLRGKLLPLVRLSDVLGMERLFYDAASGQYQPDRRKAISDSRLESSDIEVTEQESIPESLENNRQHPDSDYNILVLKVGENNFGLIVDQLYDMEEIVVKPLSSFIKGCKTFAGATIMGDGRVAMILDAGGVLAAAKLSFTEVQTEESRIKTLMEKNMTRNAEQRAVILFNNAPSELFALPLSSVLRLEKINTQRIERLGSREFISYQNKSIELFRLESALPVQPCKTDQEELFLILPKSHGGQVGIVASAIVDTLQMNEPLDTETFVANGIAGTAVINNHLTVFINPEELLAYNPPSAQDKQPKGLAAHAC